MRRIPFLALALLSLVAGALGCSAPDPSSTTVLTFQLSVPAQQAGIADQLPTTLTFHDRMGTALVAPVEGGLDPRGMASAEEFPHGTVAYSVRKRSLVVFQTDDRAAGTLVVLGRVTGGLEHLASCTRACELELDVTGDDG